MFCTLRSRANPTLMAVFRHQFGALTQLPIRAFALATPIACDGKSDSLKNVPIISLEEFYSSVAEIELTDEEALEYMTFSAKMAMVTFKNKEEMLSFRSDFSAALAFIQKLDEVDVSETQRPASRKTLSFRIRYVQFLCL